MQLKAIEIAQYRRAYIWPLLLCIISIAASFYLVKQGYFLLANEDVIKAIKYIFLLGTAVVAAIFSSYMKKQKQKLIVLSDLDEKLVYYKKLFHSRLWFQFFYCMGYAFFYYLTASKILFYLGLFGLFLMLVAFPSKLIIRKELNEEDLIIL